MSGTRWNVPPIPNWGVNDNPLQRALDRESGKFHIPLPGDQEYRGFSKLGIIQGWTMIFWHLWQRGTKGAEPKIHHMDRNIAQGVLGGTCRELQEKGHGKLPVKDSDILFSWIITVRRLCFFFSFYYYC